MMNTPYAAVNTITPDHWKAQNRQVPKASKYHSESILLPMIVTIQIVKTMRPFALNSVTKSIRRYPLLLGERRNHRIPLGRCRAMSTANSPVWRAVSSPSFPSATTDTSVATGIDRGVVDPHLQPLATTNTTKTFESAKISLR